MNSDELTFALDIGTRTVVGVVGTEKEYKFEIAAYEAVEHKSRAMLDGQVHDIEEVASVVIDVKQKLEKKLGIKLKRVAIAAAGRVLKTRQVKVERVLDSIREIDNETITSLEIEGIQLAKSKLDEELSDDEKTTFYCVGYSVINYYLNSYSISSLSGHKGKSIGADILATFLPHTVVDSLYTVVERAGLEVSSLTLEPIAAINVVIPKDLRLLNLCLVDIGAGTSDIAITRNGSVVAYAMVPVAGDEITEAICQNFLVDFNTAEKIKMALSTSRKEICFSDIMGIKQTKTVDEIRSSIVPAVENLADTISEKIIEYNGKAPNAVFLIGGGSRIKNLDRLLAQRLNLPEERVAVRGTDVIRNLKYNGKKPSGPEAITPIGIAVTSEMQKGADFLYVNVNGKRIRLFNSRELTVSDALVLAGFTGREIIGRSGRPLSFELNGEVKTIAGEPGEPCEIYVNGEPANLKTVICSGDNITVKQAQEGKKASMTIAEILEYYSGRDVAVTVNGEAVSKDYVINNGDKVEVKAKEEIIISYNEVNSGTAPVQEAALSLDSCENQIAITVNGSGVVLNGNRKEYIFVDIFNYIDFDLSKPQGSIVLKLNGKNAAYTDAVKDGDVVEIYWER